MNANDKDTAESAISGRILQTILGVDAMDQHSEIKSTKPSVLLPDSPTDLTSKLHIYSCRYSNPGYGSFTLCDPSSTSDYCTQVLSDFAAVDNTTSRPDITGKLQLYAAWPRIFASHVRLVHLSNNTFITEVTKLFPDGYGRNRGPFAAGTTIGGVAEFVVKDGKVIGVGIEGGDTNGQRHGSTIQERADIWFDRIQ